MNSLFERVGNGNVRTTEFCRGPWDTNACHGGPVAALAAWAIESLDGQPGSTQLPMMISRLTIELERPVPLAELIVAAEVTRPGRNVRIVDVSMSTTDGRRVARARALQQRLIEIELPASATRIDAALAPGPVAGPEDIEPSRADWGNDQTAFHVDATEHRFLSGTFNTLGPVEVWTRLLVPLFVGEAPTPTQRAAAVTDFGNGVSAVLPFTDFLFINPDLTIHFDRPPTDEWVCLRSRTYASSSGTGSAESELFDRHGRLGRATQSLLIDRR